MKITVPLLDDSVPFRGLKIRVSGLVLPPEPVPLVLEGRAEDINAYVGKATLRLDAGVVWGDLEWLSWKVPEPSLAVLYASPVLMPLVTKGEFINQFCIPLVGLTINQPGNKSIKPIASYGAKP